MIVIFTHDVLIYLLMLSISLISYDTAQKASPEIPFRSYRRTLCPLRECNPSNMAIVVRPLQQSADDQSGGGLIGQRVGDFVSPREPAGHEFAGKEFQPGTGTRSFDHFSDRIRLLAMATAWRLDPTAQTPIIEPIILSLHSREEDFMRHPPVMASSDLGLAPNEFRHAAKSPMLHDLVSGSVIGVRKCPQMNVAPFRREFVDWKRFQSVHVDIHIWRNRACYWPGWVDHD